MHDKWSKTCPDYMLSDILTSTLIKNETLSVTVE